MYMYTYMYTCVVMSLGNCAPLPQISETRERTGGCVTEGVTSRNTFSRKWDPRRSATTPSTMTPFVLSIGEPYGPGLPGARLSRNNMKHANMTCLKQTLKA